MSDQPVETPDDDEQVEESESIEFDDPGSPSSVSEVDDAE